MEVRHGFTMPALVGFAAAPQEGKSLVVADYVYPRLSTGLPAVGRAVTRTIRQGEF